MAKTECSGSVRGRTFYFITFSAKTVEPQASEPDKNIKSKLHLYKVKINFPNEGYKYPTRDINLNKGNEDELKRLFNSLTAIK